MPLKAVLVAVAMLLTLAACGFGVDEYPTAAHTATDCDALYHDLPNTVDHQKRREVKDDIAAAWGDSAIILRCGVQKPDALNPASQCYDVDGVGWFAEKEADSYLFTTIGRRFFISIEVPNDHSPQADALVDLAESVKKHDPVVKNCV